MIRTFAPAPVPSPTLSSLAGMEEVFALADVPLLLVDQASGAILRANPAALELLERSAPQVLGRSTTELGLWADPLERSRQLRHLQQHGALQRLAVTLVTGSGAQRQVRLTLRSLQLGGQDLLLKTLLPIDHPLAALHGLEPLGRLLELGNRTPDWRCLPEGGQLQFSPTALQTLGWHGTADAPAPAAPAGLVHAEDFKALLKNIQHAAQAGVGVFATVRLLHGSGVYRWCELRGDLPRRASDQAGVRRAEVVGSLRDVHASEEQKLARRREAERAILAIEGTGVGTWEAFPDNSAVWDDQTYRLYGHDPGSGQPPLDIYRAALGEDEYERTSKWLSQSLREGSRQNIEFQIRWPNGEVHWLAAKGRRLLDENGRSLSLLGINWDVTEQRRAHEALLAHQRELSRLTRELMEQERQTSRRLAMTLHDHLGQTLTAMRLHLDRHLQRGLGDAHPLRQMDQLLDSAVDEVRHLLEDLRPTLLEEQGLGPALDNELARLNQQAQDAEFVLLAAREVMAARWPAEVEYAFFMVARESLLNALRHAQARLVQVELAALASGLVMEVVDDGIGFAPGPRSARPGHLGMTGMRERAEAIGARLKVTSSAREGTRITLSWSPCA